MGLVRAESSGQGNFHSLFGSCRTHKHTHAQREVIRCALEKTSVCHIISYVEVFLENSCMCENRHLNELGIMMISF